MLKKKGFGLITALMLITLLLMWNTEEKKADGGILPYHQFMDKAKKGEVQQVIYSENALWEVLLSDGTKHTTQNPRIENGKEALLNMGIDVQEKNNAELLPVLLLFAVFALMMKKRPGDMEKYASMETGEKREHITFSDVVIGEETRKCMEDLVQYMKAPEIYERMGARPPRGVMLYGPPGTGKTMLAKALAGETGKPFFAVSGSDFVQVYVGVGASRIRSLFRKAEKAGGGVIFIDEIDALGKKRDNGNDEREQTLNALLTEMSGFSGKVGIIVLAATNRLDTLDKALLREGRFDRHIEVSLPDKEGREKILHIHSGKKPLSQEVDLNKWAEKTVMFSGAQLESMMNEAAIRAIRERKAEIENRHIENAFLAQTAGEEKAMVVQEKEKRIIAVHEAGHALLTHLLLPGSRLERVTIIPSNKGAAGYSMAIHEDKMLHTREELLCQMAVMLGGRAAEERMFGKDNVTNGAGNDLEKAEHLARMMQNWRMSEERDAEKGKMLLMEEGCEKARLTLEENGEKLCALADSLMEKETLTGKEVLQIVTLGGQM